MEGNPLLPAQRADLGNGLDGAHLIVGVHDGDQRSILPDRGGYILHLDQTLAPHTQQSDLKALPLQLFEGVEDGMVLKGGGDDVALALPGAYQRGGADGLVVGLASTGGEVDLLRLCTQAGCYFGPASSASAARWPTLCRLEGLP